MKLGQKIVSGVMAGFSISFGAAAFLLTQSVPLGALFFSIGILMVANFNAMLVTRVIPLLAYENGYTVWDALLAYVTNAAGAALGALALFVSRQWNAVAARVQSVVTTKCEDSFLSLFVLGILCAALVAYGVLSFKKHSDNKVAAMLYLMFFITVFVACGFDHIVANMVYYAAYLFGFGWCKGFAVSLLAATLGNVVGGAGVGYIQRFLEKK